MASEKVLDVEIYHDSCHIVAHLEGNADPMECKQEIMDLLDELGIFVEGKWTISFQSGPDDPNAKLRYGSQQGNVQRKKETN